ncbi:MAG: DUF3999 family protein [Candidatus Moraniibacteriota bacterium]
MKKIGIVFALFLFIVPVFCLADFNMANWKYYKEISNAGEGLSRINLDDEVFSGATKDLSDLRIIDSENKEVPFKLVSGKEQFKKDRVAVRMINNSFIPGENSQVILDLGTSGSLVNNLTINTTSENFQRNVKVYGGDDKEKWNVLKDDGYIYDFTDKKANFKSQNTEILFSDSAFRYIKIEIADENGNPVKILSVETGNIVKEKTREYARHPQIKSNENTDKKITEIIVDLGASGIPTGKINIGSENVNFNRSILVYASNENNGNNWTYLSQGYIFRYETPKFIGENMTVAFPETNKRFIKIEIANKDDAPIVVSGIDTFSIYREIIFQTKTNEQYRLFYGNKKADYPQYDLEKYFQYLEPDKAVQATLSGQKDNAGYVPEIEPVRPLTERAPYLLSGILVATSLLLILLVFKFLKK